MDAKGFAVSLVIIILASAIRSGSTTPFESCSSSHFILAGEFLKSTEQEDCNITIPNDDPEDGSVQKLITEEGIMLSKAGSYSYQCQSIEGSITVVQLQHKVALCSNCTRQELTIQQNEVVHWTVIDQLPCANTHLFINGHVIDNFTAITGVQKTHFFNESGLYQLKCTSEVLLNINVTNGQSTVIKYTYMELIYTHGAIMAVSFGLMIPLGALMAHFKKSIIHMIIQPLAIILTCLGFILAVVYTELNNNTHFNQLHSILGLIILIIAMLILPGLKLSVVLPITKKGRKILTGWHKRLGTSTVFFGIFNIFLGLLALPVPYYVTIVYGMWVALIVIIYVMSGLIKKDSVKTNEDEESILTTCCRYRSDQIDLSRRDSPGPTKLSKDLVSHEKFILARKKSIDMVEMTEVLPEKNNVPPQRKKSNVQFGPVAASLISPPPPDTPQSNNLSQTNVNQFGFVDKYSSSDYSSSDDSESDNNQSDNGNDDEIKTDQPKGPFAFLMNKERLRKESQASLRITRHSDRAHTKLADVFQRSNSIVHDPLKPSPLAQSLERDKCVIHINDKEEEEEEKQTKEASPITPPEEKPSGGCPFHNTEETNLPLQQRRMRRHGIMPEQPQTEQLELPDDKPIQRSVSINSSFRRKQQNIVDQTLKSVMSMSDDAIICANAQGEVVFWSAGAVKMFGYTPREAIGSSLQMIMPTRYKEKHQNGINGRTDRAIEYIKKHNTAPEEQKHARLYSVQGISKTGKEFDVEVVVTSFVIEGEIFYTGIITEVKGLSRQLSASSLSSEAEIRERQQKAMAIGAQMKIAHKLRSAEHISKLELTRILKSSIESSQFEVPEEEIELMVDAIMKAGEADDCGIMKFVDLIDLLAKHRLFISDSGLIAKYGKTKDVKVNLKKTQNGCNDIYHFFQSNLSAMAWMAGYFLLSLILVLVGILTTPEEGWKRYAYGVGPVLSLNCVLLLLPMLNSIVYKMRNSTWVHKVIPINKQVFFHLFTFAAVVIWTIVHVVTHFCSFLLDDRNETSVTVAEHFKENLLANLMPIITGFLCMIVLVVMLVSSIKPLRSLCLFIGYYSIHWGGLILMYLLLLIHGVNYFNPSFWKWLLPVAFIYILERIHNRWIISRYTVKLIRASPYDETSRTTKVEIEKPKYYKFTPGQHLFINMTQIGYFNWQDIAISSTNKEKTLTLYLPHTGSAWLQKSYSNFKKHPFKPQEDELALIDINVSITQPFGVGANKIFDYKAAVLFCGEGGPPACRSIIQKFLEYRRNSTCHCGCHPALLKLYFVWVTPSGNDNEWFTDFLSELIEDQHLAKYFDIRIFLTNIDSPPDELASALLHLALKTGGPALSVRRPSQPQLSKLHPNTSYGIPDFEALLDFVSMQQGTATEQEMDCGVFIAGKLPTKATNDLIYYCNVCSNKKHLDKKKLEEINSPYRRPSRSSTSNSSDNNSTPQPPQLSPKEWHIKFIPETLML